jgi:hypothetical protein
MARRSGTVLAVGRPRARRIIDESGCRTIVTTAAKSIPLAATTTINCRIERIGQSRRGDRGGQSGSKSGLDFIGVSFPASSANDSSSRGKTVPPRRITSQATIS